MYVGYVLINCDLGAEEYVADEIRKIPHVSGVQLTFGAYDIVVKVHASDQDEFDGIPECTAVARPYGSDIFRT